MKYLLIVLVSIGLNRIALCQMPAFCLGPKIGYNTTNLTTDADQISSELLSKFQFGAFARFGDKVFIQPEVNYVTKGGTLKGQNTDGTQINQEVTLNTLTKAYIKQVVLKSNIRGGAIV